MADPAMFPEVDTTDDDDECDEEEVVVKEEDDGWRLREMADTVLMAERGVKSSNQNSLPWKRFTAMTTKIQIWHPRIVQKAFDAAAMTVVRALSNPTAHSQKQKDSQTWRKDLPKEFNDNNAYNDTRPFSDIRMAALESVSGHHPRETATGATTKATASQRQFTRNTPASTAASLDARLHSTKNMLASAANLLFSHLTIGEPLDALHGISGNANLGAAVVLEAQTHAESCRKVVENAICRSEQRMEYRKCNALYDLKQRKHIPFGLSFAHSDIPYRPNLTSHTSAWQTTTLPRLQQILAKGAGHAILYDVHWNTRHGRIASILHEQASNDIYGPHLILTVGPEIPLFCQEFRQRFRRGGDENGSVLHATPYLGSAEERQTTRKQFGTPMGLAESSIHVVVASVRCFLEDYLHFCQMPWHTVIVDDGVAWMCGSKDGGLATIWDSLFSSSDHHFGLAGTLNTMWDYTEEPEGERAKEALIGLTARHRILTASSLTLKHRQNLEQVPVGSMLQFLMPNFISRVREEWDRSKIVADASSMKHFRQLVARCVAVHQENPLENDTFALVLNALEGKVLPSEMSTQSPVPQPINDEEFCSLDRLAYSRRNNLLWMGPRTHSWLRHELGMINFTNLLAAVKWKCDKALSTCEEITTASSTTSTGATGQIAGSMAYRFAVRCGRHFGSEQGLRQHINTHHAPAGTWLCRACSADCVTSQARTHHERTCGLPVSAGIDSGTVGATPTVGQRGAKKVAAKKKPKTSTQPDRGADALGTLQAPGYRGIWVNKAGKHFVKVDGNDLKEGDNLLLFETADEAAKKYDDTVKSLEQSSDSVELNFKDDGSRIVYDDITASTASLGGSAANVVPALSVISIKNLPPDVKPLLRDPRQTSRTGGNSKRHIYAYRGVCRQARKGHDRWQSQISFMGVNHYLGTFDSEWDAAAIYAWAHLILYGEEATRVAQKEGEEAAAAYEQEKRDIAEGKIPETQPKPEKKKKAQPKKKKTENDGTGEECSPKKRKVKEASSAEKKPRGAAKASKAEKELLAQLIAKGMTQAPVLSPLMVDDTDLRGTACKRAKLAKETFYYGNASAPPTMDDSIRPCLPQRYSIGRALLLGLSPASYGWDLQNFCEAQDLASTQDSMSMLQMLALEYDDDGVNEKFASVLQGTYCILGCASAKTTQIHSSLGLGTIPIGGTVGRLDCHVGGVPDSCSESAACIKYDGDAPSFKFACLSSSDHVTINGEQLRVEEGFVDIKHMDVCSVGARVFAFLDQ